MSQNSYVWRVYCVTEGQYVATISDTEPTTCPNNAGHTIDPSQTAILSTNFINIQTDSYINIQSTLADNQAININASDPNGGVDVNAGLGNITLNTDIGIGSPGAVILKSGALVNVDGVSGVNIGNSPTTQTPVINIGTTPALSSQTINVGPVTPTGTATVNVRSGSGGLVIDTNSGAGNVAVSSRGILLDANGVASHLSLATTGAGQDLTIGLTGATASRIMVSSAGTGADAINLGTSATAGLTSNTGTVSLVSNVASATALSLTALSGGGITLSASASGGGIVLSGGTAGVVVDASGGDLLFGQFNGGNVYLGTFASSRAITIGNLTTNTALVERWGTTGGNVQAGGETDLGTPGTSPVTPTTAQLLKRVVLLAPSVAVNFELPLASAMVSYVNGLMSFPGIMADDSFDFSIVNLNGANTVTVTRNATDVTDGSLTRGNMVVGISSSGSFRVRLKTVTGTPAYDVYRLA